MNANVIIEKLKAEERLEQICRDTLLGDPVALAAGTAALEAATRTHAAFVAAMPDWGKSGSTSVTITF
jgi:hypothetical protein